MSAYDGHQYVGIDLHRGRSVIVRQTADGTQLSAVRIANGPVAPGLQIEQAGSRPDVVVEAAYGWYWASDVLQAAGAEVHPAHPLGVKGFAYRRVKNDIKDPSDLADLLRMGRLPESWTAPPDLRELRELVRYRAKLVALRSGLKAQVHTVLAKAGVLIAVSDVFGTDGRRQLGQTTLSGAYAQRVVSLLKLIDILDAEEAVFNTRIAEQLHGHARCGAIQCLPGTGPVLAAELVAEIGDMPDRTGPVPSTQRPGRAGIRPDLPTLRTTPQLPRPPRGGHRDQAPRHGAQPQQAHQSHAQESLLPFTGQEPCDSLRPARQPHRNRPAPARDGQPVRRTATVPSATTSARPSNAPRPSRNTRPAEDKRQAQAARPTGTGPVDSTDGRTQAQNARGLRELPSAHPRGTGDSLHSESITGERCTGKPVRTVREGAVGKGPEPRAPCRRPTSPASGC